MPKSLPSFLRLLNQSQPNKYDSKSHTKTLPIIVLGFSKASPKRHYVLIIQGKIEPFYKLFADNSMNPISKFLQSRFEFSAKAALD